VRSRGLGGLCPCTGKAARRRPVAADYRDALRRACIRILERAAVSQPDCVGFARIAQYPRAHDVIFSGWMVTIVCKCAQPAM
jgi:hypothetical protein